MKRTARKNTNDDLEKEFYVPQKVKQSTAKKSIFDPVSTDNKENEDPEEKITIYLGKRIPKPVLAERLEDQEETTRATDVVDDFEEMKEGEKAKKKGKGKDFVEILESKYVPTSFLFREKEKTEMFSFVYNCVKKQKFDSILISGNPGTGKTMTISYVLKRLEEDGAKCFDEFIKKEDKEDIELPAKIKTLKLNAMNYKNPVDIVPDILSALGSKEKITKSGTSARIIMDSLKQCIQNQPKDQLIVLFVDEIDNLFVKPSVAAEMLELIKIPKYNNSNFIVIGASNTIDLIVKLNKEYKVSNEIKNIVFQPYSHDEIFTILKDRIYNTRGHEDEGKLFEEMAVRFCAKKIYSLKGGDIRYVLEVIKKVYNQASHLVSDQLVKALDFQDMKLSDDDSNTTPAETKITIQDVMKVFEELYGRNIDTIINAMPQQQKLGLLALYLILTRDNVMVITKGDFLSAYNKICTTNYLPRIDITSLEDILQTYESYEFVRMKSKKKATMSLGKSPHKNFAKNAAEEIIPLITPEQIKTAFEQSDFFSRYLIQ